MTHQQIAEHLGISRAAVTQALNGTKRSTVSPAMRLEIARVAEQLGYQPPDVTTHTIGYVAETSTLRLAGEVEFMLLIEAALRGNGYRLMLANYSKDDLEPLRHVLTSKTVDGVIFTRWCEGKVRNLVPPEVPWLVTPDEDAIGPDVNQVTLDTLQAAETLTQALLAHGHERVCLVVNTAYRGFYERIKAGIRTALDQAGLPVENLHVPRLAESRHIDTILIDHLRGPNPSTAIIAESPERAVLTMYFLAKAGYRVPEDISVVSLWDNHFLCPIVPSVTASAPPGTLWGETVAQRLVELIANPASDPRQLLVPVEVIHRESIGPARRNH